MKNLFLLFVMVSSFSFAQKPIFTTAKVKAATVYFNAAEISQSTAVNLPVGTSEIVIKNVADYLNESTVQIGAASSVTVLSVQFTQNYISEYEIDETNPGIKKVRDSITLVQKEIKKIQIDSYSSQQTIALLDANQNVSGANTGLNVAELMKLVDFYKSKRIELDNAVVTLAEKEKKLNEKLTALNDKLEINTQKEEKSSKGKLIIQVMNEIAGAVNLDINYITNNASWSPFYDLRADNITSPINMMYKAQVVQSTGIDWKKVKLTLSSGNPNQNNQAPLLSSWFLRYQSNDLDAIGNGYLNNNAVLNEVGVVQGYSKRIKEGKTMKAMSIGATIQENQLNVSFDIDIPYDVLSNSKPHSVALKEIKLPATYKYYACAKSRKRSLFIGRNQ